MKATIYWINSSVAIVPRPRGGDWLQDELDALHSEGFTALLSLLTREETQELGLEHEPAICTAHAIRFISYPIADRSVPGSARDFRELIMQLRTYMAEGGRLAIHCRASVGRASMAAACLLMEEGIAPAEAIAQIERARQCPVPDTTEQRQWIHAWSTFGTQH